MAETIVRAVGVGLCWILAHLDLIGLVLVPSTLLESSCDLLQTGTQTFGAIGFSVFCLFALRLVSLMGRDVQRYGVRGAGVV